MQLSPKIHTKTVWLYVITILFKNHECPGRHENAGHRTFFVVRDIPVILQHLVPVPMSHILSHFDKSSNTPRFSRIEAVELRRKPLQYTCQSFSSSYQTRIHRISVVSSFSNVRALCQMPQCILRTYCLVWSLRESYSGILAEKAMGLSGLEYRDSTSIGATEMSWQQRVWRGLWTRWWRGFGGLGSHEENFSQHPDPLHLCCCCDSVVLGRATDE